ncbi:MAG: hypothetical protein K8L97_06040 [Anaerolineae bacterium]|nr:hypothetical protein [Anaerolineae bacterium]
MNNIQKTNPSAPARPRRSFADDLGVMRKHLAALYAILRKWEQAMEQRKNQA